MILDLIFDMFLWLYAQVLSLVPDITYVMPDVSDINQVLGLLTSFVYLEVLVYVVGNFVFWLFAYLVYTPVSWILTKIPGIGD